MRLALALLILSALPVQATPATFPAKVTDTVVLPEVAVNGIGVAELSGLGFDADAGVLHAVSDRGLVVQLGLTVTGDRITRLSPLAAAPLTDAAGVALSPKHFNPEALDVLNGDNGIAGDTTLLVVSETGPHAALFTPGGQMLSAVPLPPAVVAAAPDFGKNKGLEAMALHPTLGLLTLPEQPRSTDSRQIHTIHAEGGLTLRFDSGAIGPSVVKAMTVLPDGRLLLVERTKEGKALTPHLRLIDPATCRADGLCPSTSATLAVPGLTDADFEGITRLGPDHILLVSDDAIARQQRTVFALIRVALPPR
jgi:hypothetical protein